MDDKKIEYRFIGKRGGNYNFSDYKVFIRIGVYKNVFHPTFQKELVFICMEIVGAPV